MWEVRWDINWCSICPIRTICLCVPLLLLNFLWVKRERARLNDILLPIRNTDKIGKIIIISSKTTAKKNVLMLFYCLPKHRIEWCFLLFALSLFLHLSFSVSFLRSFCCANVRERFTNKITEIIIKANKTKYHVLASLKMGILYIQTLYRTSITNNCLHSNYCKRGGLLHGMLVEVKAHTLEKGTLRRRCSLFLVLVFHWICFVYRPIIFRFCSYLWIYWIFMIPYLWWIYA